jgi:hypothetical protein
LTAPRYRKRAFRSRQDWHASLPHDRSEDRLPRSEGWLRGVPDWLAVKDMSILHLHDPGTV